jgi:TM2 domain-containing membrane protein YozV
MDAAAEVCQRCGFKMVKPPEASAQPKKNPLMAAVASILPGLGQIYTEQTRKGVVLLVVALFMLYVAIAYRNIASELADAIYLMLVIYGAYDSYNSANAINIGADTF